jgi:hypothetical protein
MRSPPSAFLRMGKRKMPRPKLHPTEEQRGLVKSMAACGIPHEQIAKHIGIRSPKTLRRHFRGELDSGVAEANYKMARSLFESGTGGDTLAAMFWLKCRAGWRERASLEPASRSLPAFVVAKDDGVEQP